MHTEFCLVSRRPCRAIALFELCASACMPFASACMSTYADAFVRAVVFQDTGFWASASQEAYWGRCRHHPRVILTRGARVRRFWMLCFYVAVGRAHGMEARACCFV